MFDRIKELWLVRTLNMSRKRYYLFCFAWEFHTFHVFCLDFLEYVKCMKLIVRLDTCFPEWVWHFLGLFILPIFFGHVDVCGVGWLMEVLDMTIYFLMQQTISIFFSFFLITILVSLTYIYIYINCI